MASLKEIKGRIASVKSTQKITAAMKMVASAKLRKAQYQIESFLPYQDHLMRILNSFLAAETDFASPLAQKREIKRVAIVVFSSNSSLCGAFNSNIVRLLGDLLKKYKQLGMDQIDIYSVGKKVDDAIKKMELTPRASFIELMDKPNFEGSKSLSDTLIVDFLENKIDQVELVYNHFKNTAVQIPSIEQLLPLVIEEQKNNGQGAAIQTDYLVEPDKQTVLNVLIPKSIRTKLHASLLDSAAAEQAARTMAMQIATDNANDMLDELSIQYNKQRQQTITSELLDIVGGSEALK